MKKHLLFALSVGFCISVSAQNRSEAVKQNVANNENNSADNSGGNFQPTAHKPLPAKTNAQRAITRTKFTSSYNALTLLVTESNCLTADQGTGLVMFTHRISKDWHPAGVNSGFIQSTYTSNYGSTWDSLLQVQSASPSFGRYPSGAIFNPTANTTPGNAFGVVSGPITSGAATNGWVGNFFASTQLNHTNNNYIVPLNSTAGVGKQWFPRISIQATDTKVIVSGSLYGGDPGAAGATAASNAYRGATINYATPSGSNFLWTIDSIKPSFKTNPTALNNEALAEALMAWSKDGATGYLIFTGIDAAATNAELAYQPIVYKTTNGNAATPTWTKMPIFDFSSIPAINARLRPSNVAGSGPVGPKKAWYSQGSGMDAVVDANGVLHIVCVVASGYTTSADSLDYSFNTSPYSTNYIFDTYTSGSSWNATLVDSLLTVSASTNSPLYSSTGKVSCSARIQASMSADRTHIFYMWTDSDPSLVPIENVQPDIFGKGYNVSTHKSTPTTMFTSTGDNYFMYTSNVALSSGTTYKIPTTISLTRNTNVSGDIDSTTDHYFVAGIQFDESEFTVGINEITEKGNIIISQNYPNPFSKSTSIDVTLKDAANVSIDVYNAVGQKVIAGNSEKLTAGTHTLTIDGSKLTAGIYFYTVKTGETMVTRKMIVQ